MKPTLKSASDLDKARSIFKLLCSESNEMRYMVIEGDPKSKMRPKFGKGRVYKSQEQRNNEEYLALNFRKSFKKPYTTNIAIGCIFFRSNRQRIDVDNMLKNVMDAANGIIWLDDSQVTAKVGVLELDSDRPRTVLVIGHHESTMTRDLETKKKCMNCGKQYEVSSPYWNKTSKYCSRECASHSRGESLKALKKCKQCGKGFKRKNYNQLFCSNDCRLKNLHKKRRKLRKGECSDCGKELSKPGYVRCRECWKKSFKK